MEQTELSFRYETISSSIGKFILNLFLGLLFFIGIILLAVGSMNFTTDGNLISGLKYIFPGTTLFFFTIMILLYNKISSKTKIVKSYFDTVNKRYYLETKNGKSGYIPFNEIDSLAMRKEVVSGNKSRTIYYVVYFIKKDGAWWDVYSNGSEVTALKKLNDLQERVKFSKEGAFNLLEEKETSKSFTFEEKEDSVLFKWGEQVSILYRITGILAVISFLGSFVIIASISSDIGQIGYYLVIGFSIIFGLLVLSAIYKALFGYKDFSLEISKEKVVFSGVKGKKQKILSEIQTNEIKFTQYSYNIIKQDIFNGQEIFLLNQEYADKLAKYKNGEFGIMEILGLLKEIKSMKKNIIKLPFPGFKALDIILFEKKLDEELQKINPNIR